MLDLWAHSGTTREGYLVVFITVQNLVRIAVVVLIVRKFEYFVFLAVQYLFEPPMGCFGGKNGDSGHFQPFYPNRDAITRNCPLNTLTSLTCL